MDSLHDDVAQRCPTKAFLPMSFLGIRIVPAIVAGGLFFPVMLLLDNIAGVLLECVVSLGGGWVLTKVADNYPLPVIVQHLTCHRVPLLSDVASRVAERAGALPQLHNPSRCDP